MSIGTLCLRVLISSVIASFVLPMATHAAWISADDNTVFFNDPTKTKDVKISWDASDLQSGLGGPVQVSVWYKTNGQNEQKFSDLILSPVTKLPFPVTYPNTYELCIWSGGQMVVPPVCTTVKTALSIGAQITVLDHLCQVVDCELFAPPPKIEYLHDSSNMSSEGFAVIKGSGLGHEPGEIFLVGLKNWNDTLYNGPGAVFPGMVKLITSSDSSWLDFWTPTLVWGDLPPI